MFGSRRAWRRLASLIGGACLGTALSLPGQLLASDTAPTALRSADKEDKEDKEEKKDGKDEKPARTGVPPHLADVPVLDLASCKILGLTKQPAIAAAQAGYQSAIARQNALLTIRVPTFLARDLPLRRTQANVGVNIAQFDILRVQLDTVYSVTYSYLTAQYAAEQRAMLEDARGNLLKLQDGVRAGLKAGKTNIRKEDEPRVEMYLHILDARREEATQGEQRAVSALREAMGIDAYCTIILRAIGQYRLKPDLYRDQVIAEALSRRPEIHQATLLTQVHDIEVHAQSLHRLFPTSPTFASGSDLHGRPLPAGSYDENYRPAAIGPEMPVTINGNKSARAEVAKAYLDRAGSVLDKSKILITLETEQAYLRYLEACRKLPELTAAVKNAQAVFDAVDSAFNKGERATTVRDWLSAGSSLTELRSQVNQTRYQLLVALAGLERATGGGYRACFEFAPTSDPVEEDGKKDKDKKKDDDNGEKLDNPNGGKKKD